MKKVLLLFAMCSSLGAWAQSASFDTSTPGTLKIKASGDLTSYSFSEDVTTTKFASAAVGVIFTDQSGTSVTLETVYDEGATYYTATQTWSESLFSGVPTGNTYVNNVGIVNTINVPVGKKLYKVNGSIGTVYDSELNAQVPGFQAGCEVSNTEIFSRDTWAAGDFTEMSYYFLWDADKVVTTYPQYALSKAAANGITFLSLSELDEIVSSETRYTCNSNSLYVSTDGGATKSLLTNGTVYTYHDGETFYTPSSTEYNIIEPNATYFAANATYLRSVTTPVTQTFKEALTAELASGSYTTVVFEQNSGAITIDPAIVQIITANANVVTADFGKTTVTTYESLFGTTLSASLHNLTFPLTQTTGDDMIFPAGVFNSFQWRFLGDGVINPMNITIPEGYTKIAADAFGFTSAQTHGLPWITSVSLPSTLVEIGECAFLNATGLEVVTYSGYTGNADVAFPANLEKIHKQAFSGCDKLVNFDFNSKLEFIGNSAFYLNHTVGGQSPMLNFPASLKYLGPGSFNNRDFAEVYFHGETAPICPVGPYYDDNAFKEQDVAAFSAPTHMGNNGFVPDATTRGGDNANIAYANRENYYNNGTYFTVLHFPAGVTAQQAKTFKDITRRYETVEDLSTFVYNASMIDCGSESDQTGVMSFKDYNSTEEAWASKAPLGKITAGHIDTYLGRQKIWPSQSQWMRAYTTVANGLEWNGVDTYRPVMTEAERAEMLSLMAEDGLKLWDGTKYVAVGSDEYAYTVESADAYNLAHFPNYWNENTIKDPAVYYSKEDVDGHNATLDNALHEGDNLYPTPAEIAEHNATLDAVKHENDVQTPGHGIIFKTFDEFKNDIKSTNPDDYRLGWAESDYESNCAFIVSNNEEYNEWAQIYIKEHSADDDLFTADEAEAYNIENVEGYWTSTTVIGKATAEQAAAYNLTLDNPGVWQYGKIETEATHYSADEIAVNNAAIEGLVKAGDDASVNEAMADYISKIAYQSTRRFVLADDGSNRGDTYEITLAGANWWTIVFPFSMTKAEVDEVFGTGTHVCLFSGVDRGVGQDGTKQITLKFQNDVYAHSTPISSYREDANGNHYAEFTTEAAVPGENDIVIKAFEAYMIRPTKGDQDAATFEIQNPRIEQGAPFPTVIKANTTISNRNTAKYSTSEDHTEYRFVGNLLKQLYDAETETFVSNKIPQYSYMYAKKKGDSNYKFWFNTSENITWAINKCVVQATAKDGGYRDSQDYFGLNQPTQAKQISIFGDFYDEYNSEEAEATGVENVTIIAGDGEDSEVIYNLNGQMINPNAASNGVYIKGGKKVFVK